MASEYGAFDLSALGNKNATTGVGADPSPSAISMNSQAAGGATISGAFIRDADDTTFNEVAELSLKVPIILDLWAQWCSPCKQLSPILEELAHEYAGRFQLVKVDVEKSPQLAQAFQAQSIPMLVAIIGGRPAPLFQGVQPKEQIRQIIDQVLAVAAQNGIEGVLSGNYDSETETVLPEQAEVEVLVAAGDLETALQKAEKALRNQPQHAKLYQAMVDEISFAIRLRSTQGASEDPHMQADQLFAAGQAAQAYQLLLDLIATTSGEDQEKTRLQLLEMLRLGSDKELINQTRMKLAGLLF